MFISLFTHKDISFSLVHVECFACLSGSFERTPPYIRDLWHPPSSLLMQMSFTVGANCFTELLQIKSRCLSLWMDATCLWEGG
jgi:hypothetical protein